MTSLFRRGALVVTLGAVTAVPLGVSSPADGAGAAAAKLTPFAGNLTGVTAVSARSAWAVGYQTTDNDVLLEHWDGTEWAPQDHPASGSSAAFLGVSASSASDVWAVGSHYIGPDGGHDTGTYVQHYDGASWTLVEAPNPGDNISVMSAVDARTATDAWAVGFQTETETSPGVPLIEHWNGVAWKSVKPPATGDGCFAGLTGVTSISASDAWAVGNEYCGSSAATLTVHWNGHRWARVPSPNPGGSAFNLLNKVTAVSSTDVWAVGAYADGADNVALALHWEGHKWKVVPTPDGNKATCPTRGSSLIGVSGSGDNLWAVGGRFCGDDVATLVLRWNGKSWKVSPSRSPHDSDPAYAELTDVESVSGKAAFAVGITQPASGEAVGFIQRWNGQRWSLY